MSARNWIPDDCEVIGRTWRTIPATTPMIRRVITRYPRNWKARPPRRRESWRVFQLEDQRLVRLGNTCEICIAFSFRAYVSREIKVIRANHRPSSSLKQAGWNRLPVHQPAPGREAALGLTLAG